MDRPDLVGIAEIADALGVSRQAVTNWRTREWIEPAFPDPWYNLACGPIFSWLEVLEWSRQRVARPDLLRWTRERIET